MKSITVTLTDEQYAEVMDEAIKVREFCEKHRPRLRSVKSFVAECAKINLVRNMDYISKNIEGK